MGGEQLSLFDEAANVVIKERNSANATILPRPNFGIQIPYLTEHLAQYNKYLKQSWQNIEDLKDDNLLLRTMFGGIENSLKTPPEIFDGLNALEICLMEAGIYKRKYIYLEEMTIKPNGSINQQPITVQRKPDLHAKESKIKKEGHLDDDKHLYEIVNHLLTATGVEGIYKKYQKDWEKIFNWKNPGKKQKRYKRLNPYGPSTLKLKRRMDYIEKTYPDVLRKFKEVLAKPFIPEKIRKMDEHGNTVKVINPEGFDTPGKTYHRGVRGKSFWRLNEFADKLHDYFHYIGVSMQSSR